MRFWLVLALVSLAWAFLGSWSLASGVGLCLAAGAGFACTRASAERVRRLAPLAPALALLVRAIAYAAAPRPMRVLLSLAILFLTALVLHLALHPLSAVSRAARIAARLALSAAVVLAVLAGAERIYRAFSPLNPYWIEPELDSAAASVFAADAELGSTLSPGFRGRFVHPEYGHELVEINAQGFRDRPWEPAGEPASGGLLLLGDSTLFGFGVERAHTIAAQLEALLAQTSTSAERVYNAGVPGYGPPQELAVLRHWIERLHPRACALLFYDGNDLDDCIKSLPAAPAPAPVTAPVFLAPRPTPPLWSRAYWVHDSILGRHLEHRLARELVALGWVPLDVAWNSEFLRAMRIERDARIEQELELAWQALAAAAEECRKRGVAFAFVRLPGNIQAEPTTFRTTLEHLGQDPARFDRARPGSLLLARAQAAGLPALDLLPVLEVGEGALSPYYFREGHPDGAGNQRIARELAAFLARQGLWPAAR